MSAYLSVIRIREAIIFQSPSVVAMAVYLPEVAPPLLWRVLLLSLGCFLIMTFIFAYNDWADLAMDDQVPGQKKNTYLQRGVGPGEMLRLSIGLAGAGTLIIAAVAINLLPVTALMILLGLAYSVPIPGLKGKAVPVYASTLHFAGILLCFVFGTMAVTPLRTPAMLVGCYFGVLITAGHLVQEVQDYASDRASQVATLAVRLGQRSVFLLSFALFGFSFLFLYVLAQAGLVPAASRYATLLFPIYALWAWGAYRAGLDEGSMRTLRNRYRVLFGIVVMVMIVGALAAHA